MLLTSNLLHSIGSAKTRQALRLEQSLPHVDDFLLVPRQRNRDTPSVSFVSFFLFLRVRSDATLRRQPDLLEISGDGTPLEALCKPGFRDGDAVGRPLALLAGLGEPLLDLGLQPVQGEEDVLGVARHGRLVDFADLAPGVDLGASLCRLLVEKTSLTFSFG